MPHPFKVITIAETGERKRVPWDATKANDRMLKMRAEAKAVLMARDVERGSAAGADVSGGRLNVLVSDGQGSYHVDPIASKIHHSGAELNDLFRPRWYEFCGSPQNEDAVEYPVFSYTPKQERKQALASIAQEAESANGEAPAMQVRRPRGRPRKQQMDAM
jgi:hypothetical protein